MEHITLGKYEEIPVYPQKWAYLSNRSAKAITQVFGNVENLDQNAALGGTLLEWAGSSAYDLLVALVPTVGKRMPEYEFHGYNSKEAWDNGDYDPEDDPSPTVPEIINAFNVAIRVNRFDLVSVLKNIIDPKELRGPITKRIADAISRGSLNSQQADGELESMNSSQKNPTLTENGELHSTDLTSSQENTSSEGSVNSEN